MVKSILFSPCQHPLTTSLMMAHQLAAVHRVVMDQMAFVPSQYDVAGQEKRLNAVEDAYLFTNKGYLQ